MDRFPSAPTGAGARTKLSQGGGRGCRKILSIGRPRNERKKEGKPAERNIIDTITRRLRETGCFHRPNPNPPPQSPGVTCAEHRRRNSWTYALAEAWQPFVTVVGEKTIDRGNEGNLPLARPFYSRCRFQPLSSRRLKRFLRGWENGMCEPFLF